MWISIKSLNTLWIIDNWQSIILVARTQSPYFWMLKCVPNLQISYSRHNLVFRSRKLYRMSTMYPPCSSSQFLLKHKYIQLSYLLCITYFIWRKIQINGFHFVVGRALISKIIFGNGFRNWLKWRIVFRTLNKGPRGCISWPFGEFMYYIMMCIFWKNVLNFSRTLYFLAR